MHVVKDFDVRMNEFLDTAQRLFLERGYEETPISAIIDAVGVSKGAFYHYFASKDDLINALAERAARQGIALIQPIADDPALPALDKLNRVFAAALAFKSARRELMLTLLKVMYDDRNLLLRKRMERKSMELEAPLISRILAQGIAEGAFKLSDPAEAAMLILQLGTAMTERLAVYAATDLAVSAGPSGLATEATERVQAVVASYREAVTRVLGAAPGSVALMDDRVVAILAGKDTP